MEYESRAGIDSWDRHLMKNEIEIAREIERRELLFIALAPQYPPRGSAGSRAPVARARTNLPAGFRQLAINEREVLNKFRKNDINPLLYVLGEGRGRARGTKTGMAWPGRADIRSFPGPLPAGWWSMTVTHSPTHTTARTPSAASWSGTAGPGNSASHRD